MIRQRHKRTVVWVLVFSGLVAGLCLIEIEDRPGGAFRVRAVTRAELRAPVSGFLREVHCEEGDRVSPGTPVALFEVPDLSSRLAQKGAEGHEVQARLRLLEVGPRSEEIAEKRGRVERARAWHDLARQDLARLRQACASELAGLDERIAERRAEVAAARDAVRRTESLAGNAIALEAHREAERRYEVGLAQLEQARAERHARESKGTLEAEAELARRERELADARATLALLVAGPRVEEVEAERARLARLREEVRYLEKLQVKLAVHSSVPGVVTTPRLRDKIGQYMREGEPICEVEEPTTLEIEVTLAEQDMARVRPGQGVVLRARALPFEALQARVDRIAPAASHGDVQSTVAVYCRLDDVPQGLRPGMTGYGRIDTGPRPVGGLLLHRAFRWLRTECWWW